MMMMIDACWSFTFNGHFPRGRRTLIRCRVTTGRGGGQHLAQNDLLWKRSSRAIKIDFIVELFLIVV